jgi:hypothetical protein
MLQSLMLFLAPAAVPAKTLQPPPPAAAMPADSGPAAARPGGRLASLRFLARVIGSAFGFAALFTGCWVTLRLLQVFV